MTTFQMTPSQHRHLIEDSGTHPTYRPHSRSARDARVAEIRKRMAESWGPDGVYRPVVDEAGPSMRDEERKAEAISFARRVLGSDLFPFRMRWKKQAN